jgi:glycosyltransferase involved in cell wall biosynthesis
MKPMLRAKVAGELGYEENGTAAAMVDSPRSHAPAIQDAGEDRDRLNIVVVTDSARLDGGISQVAIQSAVALESLGHRVHFFAGEGPVDPSLEDRLPRSRIHLQDTRSLSSDTNRLRAAMNGIANYDSCRSLRNLLAKMNTSRTIVHIHGWCKNLSPRIVHAAVESGFPVVQTLHEYFLVCPNGALYDYKAGEICHRAPLGLSCALCNCDSRSYAHKLWRLSRGAYQRWALGLPLKDVTYIANSPLTRRNYERFLPKGASIFDLDHPISVEQSERSSPEKQKEILFVGRFSHEKGVLQLAQAVNELHVSAVFVGEGHLRSEMERLAPQATFTGWLSNAEVSRRMRRARCLVFPSTCYETLGLVTIEAAAVGLPAIVSDCTAATDFLPDGVSSLHCRHGSVEDLKNKLLLLQDDRLVRRLSEQAYSWYWREPWTAKRHAAGLVEIYNHVIDVSTRKPKT